MSKAIGIMDACELSDEELARRARAGSSADFERLVQRYGPRLLRHLRGQTACTADAEDLRQETFLKVYQNLHRYDPTRPFSTWLFTIAVRLAASRGRGRRDVADLDGVDVAAAGPDPAEAAARAEAAGNLWALARRTLPESQYSVLWLRYGQGQSVREIAGQLGRTRIGVKVLLHRARKKMLAVLPPGILENEVR